MSNSPSVKLELADPGWLRIDEATLRVSGALDSIVREMENVLNDQTVRSLCANLGIASSGFLFFDVNRGMTRFFDEDTGSEPQTYRTQYLWMNERAGSRWSDLVHWLFVHVRTTQSTQAKRAQARTEDYFRHVPKDNGPGLGLCMSNEDRRVRKTHAVHYVTLGEMLFTMLAWRSLVAAVDLGTAELPLDQLALGLDQPKPVLRTCPWDNADLFSIERSGDERFAELRAAWDLIAGASTCLRSEWELLGMRSTAPINGDIERRAILKFGTAIGAFQDVGITEAVSDEELNAAIQRSIPRFLALLGMTPKPDTVGNALNAIERYARFPLLPFYAWHALDGAPKCYLVSPVWTSQQYSVSVDGIRCRHLGLGLSAMAPLLKIDWTLPGDLSTYQRPRYSDADPTVVINVIRLMARPLVEEHLYNSVVRELEERLIVQAKEAVREAVEKAIDGVTKDDLLPK